MGPLQRAIAVVSKSLGSKNNKPRKLLTVYIGFRIYSAKFRKVFCFYFYLFIYLFFYLAVVHVIGHSVHTVISQSTSIAASSTEHFLLGGEVE